MKAKSIAFTIILLTASLITVSALDAQTKKSMRSLTKTNCTVTYVANEGFLIETKNHKILIDALFGNIKGDWCDQPDDSVLTKMINGTAPFDNIDLIFVSHAHVDHFNRQMVIDFLKNNKKTILVCPEQVNMSLKLNSDYSIVSGRINAFKPGETFDTSLTLNKLKVRALRINHSSYFQKDSLSGEFVNIHKDVENMAYIIEQDGFTFLHTGDGTPADKQHFEVYKIRNKAFDITFLDRIFLNTQGIDIINDFIQTRYLVYMHIEPKNKASYKAMRNIPGDKYKLFVFGNLMEKMTISK
jgi:L-ascorbate metabolism protein UlaG (beta-lactamase superfamily)